VRQAHLLLLVATLAPLAQPAAKHRVLFNRFRVPEIAIFLADADGKNERPIVPHRESEYSPSLSADGKWIVFTSERGGQSDIYRMHSDGTGLEQLTSDLAFDDQGALSPDNSTLAFVSTRANGTADIWLLDIAGKKYTNLTKNASGNFRPTFSPDGKWIAFSSDRDSIGGRFPGQWEQMQSTGIYIVHPDGSGLRRVTKTGGVAGSPSFSADGSRILFYETDETGAYLAKSGRSRTELVSVDIATGDRRQYTASNDTKLSPAFLPGGRISYILRSADNNQGLKIWHPDRRVITVAQGSIRHASWSPDARQVVYERILQLGVFDRLVSAAVDTEHAPVAHP
jgi:Tol biopolymer transport system component